MLTTYTNIVAIIVLMGFMGIWLLALTYNVVSDILLSVDRCSDPNCKRLVTSISKSKSGGDRIFCCQTCKENYFYFNESV